MVGSNGNKMAAAVSPLAVSMGCGWRRMGRGSKIARKSQLILLIIVNLTFLPSLLRSEHLQGFVHDDNNATVEELDSNGIKSVPVLVDTNQQDNEVEIEDVDIEGALGPSDSFEGSTNIIEEEVQGSGNQNTSDPTAVAKVYDALVPTFVAGAGGATVEGNASGEKVAVAPKPNRIKVTCWDFRSMPAFNDSNNSSGNNNETGTSAEQESINTSEEEGLALPVSEIASADHADGKEHFDIEGMDYGNRTVEIVNMTYLLHDILYSNANLKLRSNPANCSVVMFYANWCPFSARAAPHFNALPRAYPPLRVAAIDSSRHKNVNTYFGILSVPTVVLFHNGKIIAKFNDTSFTLTKFAEFIEYFTDLKHEERINVTTKDFDGPLSSVPVKERDWYLYLSWVFIIFCFIHYVTKTAIWRRAVDFVRTTWREAEAQHEHID